MPEPRESLATHELEQIDSICAQFKVAWPDVRIEDVLKPTSHDVRAELLRSLLLLDFELFSRGGIAIEPDAYRSRFPDDETIVTEAIGVACERGWVAKLDARGLEDTIDLPPDSDTGIDPTITQQGATPGTRTTTSRGRFGQYDLLEKIAQGGMGVVYKARQRGLNRLVALKMIRSGELAGTEEIRRFQREAEAAGKLDHPSIVPVYDVGEIDGRQYFSMRFVDGHTLTEALRERPLEPRQAARLMHTICDAMAYAHGQGVLHRDLKPGNVLLTQRGDAGDSSSDDHSASWRSAFGRRATVSSDSTFDLQPLITDFGLARDFRGDSELTSTGQVMGTPSYMPPEQARGETVGPAADIYSAGAVLYAVLTGSPPFKAASVAETLQQVLTREPVAPTQLNAAIDVDLETICLKCLEKLPERRYASMADVREDLRRWLDGLHIVARPVGRLEKARRWCLRNPVLAALSSVVMFSVVAGLIGSSVAAVHFNALRNQESKAREDEAIARGKAERETAVAKRERAAAVTARATAETARAAAEKAEAEAKAANKESRARMVGLCVANGRNYADNGDHTAALAWYAKAWLDDSGGSANHRLRVSAALSRLPELVGLCVHTEATRYAEFDPSGKRLVLQRGHRALVWDPYAGKELAELRHGDDGVAHATFTPDGAEVVTCGENGLRFWNPETGKLVHHRRTPYDINRAAFQPNGSVVAFACDDGRVRFLDWKKKEPTKLELECGDAVQYVTFAPDGKSVLAADASQKLTVWTFPHGKVLARDIPHQFRFGKTSSELQCEPLFTDAGRRLVTYHEEWLEILDTTTWKPLERVQTGIEVKDMSVNDGGNRVVLATESDIALLYHFDNGEQNYARLELPNSRYAYCVAISSDGKLAATSGLGGVVTVWNSDDGSHAATITHADLVKTLTFRTAADGTHLLLSAGKDHTTRISQIAARTFQSDYKLDCGFAHKRGQFTRNGSTVAISPDAQLEFVYSGQTGRLVSRTDDTARGPDVNHPRDITYAAFSMSGRFLVTTDARQCIVRDATTLKPVGPPVTGHAPFGKVQVSEDGRRLMTWGADKHAYVWNTADGELLVTSDADALASKQLAVTGIVEDRGLNRPGGRNVAMSPNGEFIALRREQTEITTAFRVEDGRRLFDTEHQVGISSGIRFSANSRRLIVGNFDARACAWDLHTHEAVGPELRHSVKVCEAVLNPEGTRAATYVAGGKLFVWDVESGQSLAEYQVPPFDYRSGRIWFSKDSNHIVLLSKGTMQVIKLPTIGGSKERVLRFVNLLTSSYIDDTDGIAKFGLEREVSDKTCKQYLGDWRAVRAGKTPQAAKDKGTSAVTRD